MVLGQELDLRMSDIKRPEAVMLVQERPDGRAPEDGKGTAEQPPKKVTETYAEAARALPADDSITILGIPIERITSTTHAALAGLVSENNYLRNALSRHERGARRSGPGKQANAPAQGASPVVEILDYSSFVGALGAALARAPGEGASWVVILVYLKTYEILRRSSGLLAANGALDDVGYRLGKVKFGDLDHEPSVPGESAASPSSTATVGAPASLGAQEGIPIPLTLAGYAGGASVAGLVALPSVSLDTTAGRGLCQRCWRKSASCPGPRRSFNARELNR